MNAASVVDEAIPVKAEQFNITLQMKTMLDYLSEYGEIGEEELQELLNAKHTRAYLVTRQTCKAHLIVIMG